MSTQDFMSYKPDYRWELFTPARCRADLGALRAYEESTGSQVTRPLSSGRVRRYMRDMRHGHWFGETSAPVVYTARSSGGALLLDNAFHRFSAIIRLGEEENFEGVYMNALLNPRKEALISQDTGRNRSLGDLFAIHGAEHASVLGSAATMYTAWLDRRQEITSGKRDYTRYVRNLGGSAPSAARQKRRNRIGGRPYQFLPLGKNAVTHTEALLLVQQHPKLIRVTEQAVSLVGSNNRTAFISPGVVAWLLLAFEEDAVSDRLFHSDDGSAGMALNFFEQAVSGPPAYLRTLAAEGSTGSSRARMVNPEGNPAFTLHERIRAERDRRRGSNAGLSGPDQVRLIVPAWDAFRAGQPLQRIATLGARSRTMEEQ